MKCYIPFKLKSSSFSAAHTAEAASGNPRRLSWVAGNTCETRREINSNVGLVDINLTPIHVPRTQHRFVSAPVLVVQPTVSDS